MSCIAPFLHRERKDQRPRSELPNTHPSHPDYANSEEGKREKAAIVPMMLLQDICEQASMIVDLIDEADIVEPTQIRELLSVPLAEACKAYAAKSSGAAARSLTFSADALLRQRDCIVMATKVALKISDLTLPLRTACVDLCNMQSLDLDKISFLRSLWTSPLLNCPNLTTLMNLNLMIINTNSLPITPTLRSWLRVRCNPCWLIQSLLVLIPLLLRQLPSLWEARGP